MIPEYNLYKINVYENEQEEYYTFCSPECASAIDTYIEFRKAGGEKITPESPFLRNRFDRLDRVDPNKLERHIQPLLNNEKLWECYLRKLIFIYY